MVGQDLKMFVDWFQSSGGSLDTSCMDFTVFSASEGGRGAVSIKDISEGHVLFTIPRSLILSTSTSTLPATFGQEKWKSMELHQGWAGLILCMMWEESKGSSSKWFQYFATLPSRFDTPMFWNENDLRELEGTVVIDKLGKDEAEKNYNEKIIPVLQSRPDLFLPQDISTYYSLERYHIMGSRILSRSFNVEKPEEEDETDVHQAGNTSIGSDMSVDPPENDEGPDADDHEGDEHSDDESDEVDSEDTAMVPMADMLNARYGSENAKLFYERNELRMITTKPIKAGEQIWNTYGDLPNAELLRRYGHVDLMPLPFGEGNPGDVAEIRADVLVSSVMERNPEVTNDSVQERIEWWLEEGGDDLFVIDADFELPSEFISLTRLLLLKNDEWEKTKDKSKPPKPKVDADVLSISVDVLERRLKLYPTSLAEDESTLKDQVDINKRHAWIVRIGEKRILHGALKAVRALQEKEVGKNKRKGGNDISQDESNTKRKRH